MTMWIDASAGISTGAILESSAFAAELRWFEASTGTSRPWWQFFAAWQWLGLPASGCDATHATMEQMWTKKHSFDSDSFVSTAKIGRAVASTGGNQGEVWNSAGTRQGAPNAVNPFMPPGRTRLGDDQWCLFDLFAWHRGALTGPTLLTGGPNLLQSAFANLKYLEILALYFPKFERSDVNIQTNPTCLASRTARLVSCKSRVANRFSSAPDQSLK